MGRVGPKGVPPRPLRTVKCVHFRAFFNQSPCHAMLAQRTQNCPETNECLRKGRVYMHATPVCSLTGRVHSYMHFDANTRMTSSVCECASTIYMYIIRYVHCTLYMQYVTAPSLGHQSPPSASLVSAAPSSPCFNALREALTSQETFLANPRSTRHAFPLCETSKRGLERRTSFFQRADKTGDQGRQSKTPAACWQEHQQEQERGYHGSRSRGSKQQLPHQQQHSSALESWE